MGAKVKQSALADFFADPFGFDQPVGEISGTGFGGSRFGLADEHDPRDWQRENAGARRKCKLWHYKRDSETRFPVVPMFFS